MSDITPEEIAELREDAATALASSRTMEVAREVARQRLISASQGTTRITAERLRQVEAEGWTPEHDQEHDSGELARAALCYLVAGLPGYDPTMGKEDFDESRPMGGWPWEASWWKPSDDPVRNLVKAGALIAAEIDRLTAAFTSQRPERPSMSQITNTAHPMKQQIEQAVEWYDTALTSTDKRFKCAADESARFAAVIAKTVMNTYPADPALYTPEQKAVCDAYNRLMSYHSGDFWPTPDA